MAFVSENIPEKDWELFNSWELKETGKRIIRIEKGKHGPLDDYYYSSNKFGWVVDREREAYYIFLGGHDRGTIEVYVLIWQGYKIYMWRENHLNHDIIKQTRTYYVNITKLHIPICLKDKKEEILELVEETIIADINLSKGTKLEIESIAEPCFLENPEKGI